MGCGRGRVESGGRHEGEAVDGGGGEARPTRCAGKRKRRAKKLERR